MIHLEMQFRMRGLGNSFIPRIETLEEIEAEIQRGKRQQEQKEIKQRNQRIKHVN